ncbi:glycoside hydrolase family 31 protein [Arenibacter aquaticus]|uniref:Glycoside hydrolase family 31 protein n=1 Tax=Arenibacter aquaticus TaxID=2489054 RepID=A0A3S0D488_9FLAO|nr:TIM-barrel domain-containing protein [Arenibacter aquaticus]RTE52692.1 glycoside hydrolase family 31 protein [Arenibacter aquaticus]
MKRKGVLISVAVLLLLGVITYFYWILPVWGMPFNKQRHGNPPLTPSWALECWLWEDDVNTSDYVDELLEGYKKHDIPVRTILIDSPWSLRYNDFQIDTSLYKQPYKWFKKLQDNEYRVVLWMTSMVNSASKDTKIKDSEDWFNQAMGNGFLVQSDSPNKWWKGRGGFIDYTSKEAMEWWRGMQQNVFDLGVDGWKLDGTATLFWSKLGGIPFFYKSASKGLMSTRTYMDHYYRDEYLHGLGQNPEFVTLSRSIDRSFHPEGFSPIDASPVSWVGDQEHKWVTDEMISESQDEKVDIALDGIQGFESAIESILKSADLGYNIIGSDIAGFSGKTIPPRLYIRWAQFSTFCGLFMNGGHGERRLWKRSKEELQVIRKFSWLHTELVPYMYHYVVMANKGGRRLQTPLKEGKYHYMFGDDFLVAPIYMDSKKRSVSLPKGNWRYFFADRELLEGGVVVDREFPMDEFPVFVKDGAIVPLRIKRAYTGFGDANSEGFVTILVYPKNKNSFVYYHTDGAGKTNISYLKTNYGCKLSLRGTKIPHILRVHSKISPKEIYLDGEILERGKFWDYEDLDQKIIIKNSAEYSEGGYTVKF